MFIEVQFLKVHCIDWIIVHGNIVILIESAKNEPDIDETTELSYKTVIIIIIILMSSNR